jgi:respiratory burst oxidase
MITHQHNVVKEARSSSAEFQKISSKGSRWAVSEAYFFNHGANIAFLSLLMAFNLGMMVWGTWEFTPHHWTARNVVVRYTFPIARASGRLVSWNVALLLVSCCKHFWTYIRSTPIQLGFPVDSIMPKYHRVIGLTIFFGAFVHTISHVYNYATKKIVLNDGGPIWTVGRGLATRQLLITGTMLVAVGVALFVTTLQNVRNTSLGFRVFWITHVLGGLIGFPVILIHGALHGYPITLYFLCLPMGMYFADLFVRYKFCTTSRAKVVEARCCAEGTDRIVKLVVQVDNLDYTPGQYAELNIPQISMNEYHPFTIASAPTKQQKGRLVFYIRASGQWTNCLYNLVAQKEDGAPELEQVFSDIHVRGPFGAPAQNYLSYKHIIVIGSGIGVSPLLSVWNYLANTDDKVSLQASVRAMDSESSYSKLDGKEEEEIFLKHVNLETVDVLQFEQRDLVTVKAKAGYYSSILESMTVNICVFVFSLYSELIVFAVWMYGALLAAAILQLIGSLVGLSMFLSKMICSTIAYEKRYLHSFVFSLEFVIDSMDFISVSTGCFCNPKLKSRIILPAPNCC